MKTIRILFRYDMARAIVEGRKTVTRRPVFDAAGTAPPADAVLRELHTSVPAAVFDTQAFGHGLQWSARMPCVPGDLLIGRECFQAWTGGEMSGYDEAEGRLDFDFAAYSFSYRADGDSHPKRWRPSIHMPDLAARIRGRVVAVTVERVQDITEEDAVREGMEREPGSDTRYLSPVRGPNTTRTVHNARQAFRLMWDSIYAAKGPGWDANPWVWRIEFSAENVEGEQ